MDTGTLNYCWSQVPSPVCTRLGSGRRAISPDRVRTPLTLALLRRPGMTSTVIVDERCAAFFALGIARPRRMPVVVVATSGSAPANWLPAVIEADQAGVPLILISADRPRITQSAGAKPDHRPEPAVCQPGARHASTGAPHTTSTPPACIISPVRSVEAACWHRIRGRFTSISPSANRCYRRIANAIPQLPPIALALFPARRPWHARRCSTICAADAASSSVAS